MHTVFILLLLLCSLTLSGKSTENCHADTAVGSAVQAAAESRILLRGKIYDSQGHPLPGASIHEKGTGVGTVADVNGAFSLWIAPGSVLNISFIGYQPQSIKITGRQDLRIYLRETSVLLDDVVITALGLQKKEISLPYATEEISREELTRVKDPNMIVTLMGKIAGLDINKSSSGQGGSARVTLRGIRSVAGNNQPLYVIDGMPILNSSPEQPYTAIGGIADAGNRDGGDGISNLNPEDIKSISLLKGAPAAALYGTEAANGVILITTRKGEIGKQEVTLSSHLLFDRAVCLPEFQNSYGASDLIESWGKAARLTPYDHAKDFFRTGITATNALTISSGKEKIQSYFSYAHTTSKGIVPRNRFTKHNFNLRETSTLFNDRLQLDGNINLVRQKVHNRPVPGGFYMNPLVGLYRFPRGKDITPYRENYEILDEDRQLMVQNWHSSTEDFEQNPYWIVNRILNTSERNRMLGTFSAKLFITGALTLQARGTVDYIQDKFRQSCYASTAPSLSGPNGRYIESDYQETQLYGDIMAVYDKQMEDFSLNVSFGASINDNVVNSLRYDSKTASLKYPNVFNIANINMNTSAYVDQKIEAHRQRQSIFATAQVGFREMIFLDLTARNDWSSTLAYTPHETTGFFYPSIGASWILTNTFKLPSWIAMGKIRAAWSNVGNDIPLYITNPVARVLAGGSIQWADAAPFEKMKPEKNISFETGTEWHFFNQRLSFNFTYYNNHTHHQFFKLPSKNGDVYAYRYANAGNIRNTGVELSIEGQPVRLPHFQWKTRVNYSFNRNKVLSLHEELPVFTYGPSGFSSTYALKLKKGGSFGDIYGKAFNRDAQGKIVYETEGDRKGLPQTIGDGNTVKVGNANPRFKLSWNNTFTWKDFHVSFLLDGRFGGKVLSQTQADLDLFGVTQATGEARDRGYVDLEGQHISNVKGFYKSVVGGRAGVTEYYLYKATNIRLREASFGYNLPPEWIQRTEVFTDVRLSLVARNLFFLYKKAPFDPDLVLSTANDNQAIDSYGMPTTRNVGFSIRFTF